MSVEFRLGSDIPPFNTLTRAPFSGSLEPPEWGRWKNYGPCLPGVVKAVTSDLPEQGSAIQSPQARSDCCLFW